MTCLVGKTTLARAIVDALGPDNIAHISHDSYYKDLSHLTMPEREIHNFDDPNSLDTWLLTEHVQQLKARKTVEIPIYSFTTHSRLPDVEVMHPRPIILVEGILIFTEPQLIQQMDIKVALLTYDMTPAIF
jgi:uridine kinase